MRLLRAFGYCIEEAFVELWRNRLVNLVSIATIAVSLFILGVFLTVSMSLNELMEGWASRVQLTLYLLEEGSEAGVLRPVQRQLAHGMFDIAEEPLASFITPLSRVPCLASDGSKEEALALARQHGLSNLPISGKDGALTLSGYVNVAELALSTADELGPVRPLMPISERDTFIATLIAMQSAEQMLAQVIDLHGQTIGIIHADQLHRPFLESRA